MDQVCVKFRNGFESFMNRNIADILSSRGELDIMNPEVQATVKTPVQAEEVKLPEVKHTPVQPRRSAVKGIQPKAKA